MLGNAPRDLLSPQATPSYFLDVRVEDGSNSPTRPARQWRGQASNPSPSDIKVPAFSHDTVSPWRLMHVTRSRVSSAEDKLVQNAEENIFF